MNGLIYRGVSMLLGWQEFQVMQIVGFALLLLGTCVYNKIIVVPGCRPPVEPGIILLQHHCAPLID